MSIVFYMFKLKEVEHTGTFIVLEAFFTTRQPLSRACFSIACESCFTGACVRSNSIATHRINVTTVRVGRTLVDICIRIVSYIKGQNNRYIERIIVYIWLNCCYNYKMMYSFLFLLLFVTLTNMVLGFLPKRHGSVDILQKSITPSICFVVFFDYSITVQVEPPDQRGLMQEMLVRCFSLVAENNNTSLLIIISHFFTFRVSPNN